MYDIRRRRDGRKVGSIYTDPFSYRLTAAARPGLADILDDVAAQRQMNRTSEPDPDVPEDDDGGTERGGTSPEGYQDPDSDYLLNYASSLLAGYNLVPTGEVEVVRTDLEAAKGHSEGDIVDTPDGVGVVVEIRTEDFEGPDGDVEASDDDPAFVVGTQDGAAVFRAQDLSGGADIPVDGVDDPAGELADQAEAWKVVMEAAGDDGRTFDYPESWRKSSTPNRLILLKAWAGLGGRFTTCRAKMQGDVRSPARFCASMKDAVLQWEGWRRGG